MSTEKKILVVDDEKETREIFTIYFSKRGFEVVTAKDGLEAIEKTNVEKYDFIFLDIKMSGLDGIETFKRIKDKDPECKIIIMTGFRTIAKELITDSLKNQVYTILYKPFSMKDVLKIIS